MGVTSSAGGRIKKCAPSESNWGREEKSVGVSTNSSDGNTSASKSPQSALSTGTRGLCPVTTSGTKLNVKSRDTKLLASLGDILSSQHRRIRAGLITISLHLHSPCNPHKRFLAAQIR